MKFILINYSIKSALISDPLLLPTLLLLAVDPQSNALHKLLPKISVGLESTEKER